MLTTVDNPYNPFTHFDEWQRFDQQHGYYSAELLARIVITSHELSKPDDDAAIEAAIDEIVHENASGMHTKISEDE
jgi:hypothetical protein